MKAICTKCLNVIEFRFTRGNRLKDFVCSCRARAFRPLKFDYETSESFNYARNIYKAEVNGEIRRFERVDGKFVEFVCSGSPNVNNSTSG